MEEEKNKTMASEPMAMTYGMSDSLLGSDLLQRISSLSTQDKRCLISYISEEVEAEQMEDDEWEREDTSNLEPYTLEELYARIQESEDQISRGEYFTEEEVRKELKEEFLWLQ